MNWESLSYLALCLITHTQSFKSIKTILHPNTHYVFEYISANLTQYGAIPSLQQLFVDYGINWQHHWIDGITLDEVIHKLQLEKTHHDTTELMIAVQELLTQKGKIPLDKYASVIESHLQKMSANTTQTASKLSDGYNILTEYLQGSDIQTAAYGLPTLDSLTGGICSNQFILMYAQTSNGKSTFARAIAGNIAMQGKKALYITLEENPKKSVIKTMSTVYNFGARDILLRRMLTPEAYNTLATQAMPTGDVIFESNIHSMPELNAAAQKYRPDVIFVDQITLFAKNADLDWKAIGAVTGHLKQYSEKHGTPIIGLTQAVRKTNKKNPSLEDDIAYAYKSVQDADVAIYLCPDEYFMGRSIKKIQLLKNRDAQRGQSIELVWDLDNGVITENECMYTAKSAGSDISSASNQSISNAI